MSTVGLVGNNDYNFRKLPFVVASDGPETGGIGGNIRQNDKPLPPYVCEERPTTIDPKTGERVYIDKIKPEGSTVCWMA